MGAMVLVLPSACNCEVTSALRDAQVGGFGFIGV